MFKKKKKDDGEEKGDETLDDVAEPEPPARRPVRRRDPFADPFFSDPFAGFGGDDFARMDEMMQNIMKNMFKNLNISVKQIRPGELGKAGKPGEGGPGGFGKPYVYGFSMRTGPDGKPIVEEFGNVEMGPKPKVRDSVEPMVDVMEREKEIIIVVEMPGVEKDDIKLEAGEESLQISVDTAKRKYSKTVELPAKVKTGEKDIDATYKNGILEIKLQKEKRGKLGKLVKIK